MELNRTLQLAGILTEAVKETSSIPPHPGREETDAELKKIWDAAPQNEKDSFGNTLKGFMAYRRGNFTEFFKIYKPLEKK